MTYLRKTTALCAVMLGALSVASQASAVSPHESRPIHGRVIGTERAPLAGATVELAVWPSEATARAAKPGDTVNRRVIEETTTDASGEYSFANMTKENIVSQMDKDGVFNAEIKVRGKGTIGVTHVGFTTKPDGSLAMAKFEGQDDSLNIEMMDSQPVPESQLSTEDLKAFKTLRKDTYGCVTQKLATTDKRWTRLNTSYVTHAGWDFYYSYLRNSKTSLSVGVGAGKKDVMELKETRAWYKTANGMLEFPKRSTSYDASTQFVFDIVRESCWDPADKQMSFTTYDQPLGWAGSSAAGHMPINANAPHCVESHKGVKTTLTGSYGRTFTRELDASALIPEHNLTVLFNSTTESDYSESNRLMFQPRINGHICGTHGLPGDDFNPRNLQATN